jgi:uncharacterized protein (TIGR03118 family)
MFSARTSRRALGVVVSAAGLLALGIPAVATATPAHHQQPFGVHQVNLVSDLPGMAPLTDPDLVNPWGLALSATSPLWVADAGTDTSTLYSAAPAATTATKVAAVRVTFPDQPELPTGQVFNGGTGFAVSNGTTSGPARFIFSTITGRIEAWAPGVSPNLGNATTEATVAGASYTGLAIATATAGDELYAANFGQGRIDVFDSTFAPVKTSPFAFRDFFLPRGFVPFNVQALSGNIFVTYAKADPATGRASSVLGAGFVDEFTVDGRFVARVASRQSLSSPWGLAIAPASWGNLAGSLLVGNFGNGRINVVPLSGRERGRVVSQLRDTSGKVISIERLWSLTPGTASTGGTDALWFSAGIGNETHGLLGLLRP